MEPSDLERVSNSSRHSLEYPGLNRDYYIDLRVINGLSLFNSRAPVDMCRLRYSCNKGKT